MKSRHFKLIQDIKAAMTVQVKVLMNKYFRAALGNDKNGDISMFQVVVF